MTKARWLTAILALGLVVVGGPAVADWWFPSTPEERGGITYWEPRYTEFLEYGEPEPSDRHKYADVTGLTPPHCEQLIVLLRTPIAFAWAAEGHYHGDLLACLTFFWMGEARIANNSYFNTDGLISDIMERLDLRSFSSSFYAGIPDGETAFHIADWTKVVEPSDDFVVEQTADAFNLLSKHEGRDAWVRELHLLAMADLTADGNADVLAVFMDVNLGWGTYNIVHPLVLTSDTLEGPIRGVDVVEWFVAKRQHFIKKYGARP